MWIVYGLSAGLLLGAYDIFTKKVMYKNTVLTVTFYSSVVGFITWVIALLIGFPIDLGDLGYFSLKQQALLFPKNIAMTLSWFFAYYSVRELPISFSGAVRASGPAWTLIGGVLFFGESFNIYQIIGLALCLLCYYMFSVIGKKEGISFFQSKAIFMMLLAVWFSSLTTVYDKFLAQSFIKSETYDDIFSLQFYSALQRLFIVSFIVIWYKLHNKLRFQLFWSPYCILVGFLWVVAEFVYFLAYLDASASVTYLAIFRRTSLIVSFIVSAIIFREHNFKVKLGNNLPLINRYGDFNNLTIGGRHEVGIASNRISA